MTAEGTVGAPTCYFWNMIHASMQITPAYTAAQKQDFQATLSLNELVSPPPGR
jgi:hypothetical protein